MFWNLLLKFCGWGLCFASSRSQDMEREVSRAWRGGSQDEMLSEGFRLTITRKDLQTLSNLNWLNDEVRIENTLKIIH